MGDLVNWLKQLYIKAKEKDFEWKPLYPNNMPCNGKEGIYTEMWFDKDGKYKYVKFTVNYMSRCDADGISHPAEGVKYYVLHELVIDDLEEKFEIPEPNNEFRWDDGLASLVNDYGRFRYVFDDEETAKSVAGNELLHWIYPYTYIMSDEEGAEWNKFIKSYAKQTD